MPLFGSKHNKHNDKVGDTLQDYIRFILIILKHVTHETTDRHGQHHGQHETPFTGATTDTFPAATGLTGVPMGASGGAGGMAMNYPQHSLGDGPALAAANQDVRAFFSRAPTSTPLLTPLIDSSIMDNMVTDLDRPATVFTTMTPTALAPVWATQEVFLLPEPSTTVIRRTTLEVPARV